MPYFFCIKKKSQSINQKLAHFSSRGLLDAGTLVTISLTISLTIGALGRLGGEVLQAALGVGLHGSLALHPASGADLAVLVGELESLDEADGLLDVSADGQVVDGDLAEGALGVDDEETAQRDALLLNQDAVVAGDAVGGVGNEGELEVGAEAALLAGLSLPGEVRVVRVGGDGEDGGVDGAEAGESVIVLDDLGRADKGEVHGVEEKDDPNYKKKKKVTCQRILMPFFNCETGGWIADVPLSKVIRERNVLELAVLEDGGGLEAGGRALNESGRHGVRCDVEDWGFNWCVNCLD